MIRSVAACLCLWLGCLATAYEVDPPRVGKPVILAVSEQDRVEATAIGLDLEMQGIPFETVEDVAEAVGSPMIIVAGPLLNTKLNSNDREGLYSYVESGGMLVASHVHGNQFYPLFGLKVAATSRKNFRIRFLTSAADAGFRYINRPEEREFSLGNPNLYEEVSWTTEYGPADAMVLAEYEDGAPALTRAYYGRGVAYAWGLSAADFTLRPALGQNPGAQKEWANVFAPGADVLRLFLRALYESAVEPAVLLNPIPDGMETAFLLSHDLDARESFRNSPAFAAMERSFGVTSTFFVTTKYYADAADAGYYSPDETAHLGELNRQGSDLGSHSVSHLNRFNLLPLGNADVTFASYRPAGSPTVHGEVRVSKELLERDLPGRSIFSFRAGYLRHPPQLIRALEAAGYLVDSTQAAGNTRTNFAYRALRDARLGAEVTDIIEIPVTLDDSQDYLRSDNVDRVVADWTRIILSNAENNAITCMLIHPTDTTYKLAAQRRVLEELRNQPVWIGDVTRFGLWARRRAGTRLTAYADHRQLRIRLDRPLESLPKGLTLAVRWVRPRSVVIVQDSRGEPVPFRVVIRGERTLLVT